MVVRSQFGTGNHYKNRVFVEKEKGRNRDEKKKAPPCIRKWGGHVAQHTRPVLERNVCENRGGHLGRLGWKKSSVLMGAEWLFLCH